MLSNIGASGTAQPNLFPASQDLPGSAIPTKPQWCPAPPSPTPPDIYPPADSGAAATLQFFEEALQMIFSVVDRALALVYSTMQLPETPPPAEEPPTGGTGNSTGGTTTPTTPNGTAQPSAPTCGCPISETPTGSTQKLRQLGDFLWKPSGAKDGKLVILTPKKLTGSISTVDIRSADGKILASGKFTGVSNGEREHYRFDQPGAAYPAGCVVEIHLKTGATRTVNIADPGKRFTY